MKRKGKRLSRSDFARLHGVSEPAIGQAVRRGSIVLTAEGAVDPTEPVNVLWAERHAARVAARTNGRMDDARLAQLQGAVVEKEFDLALLRANTVEAMELRVRLYAEADAVDGILKEFPERMAAFWGHLFGTSFGPALTSAMDGFRCRRGDQHQAVDRALAKAAGQWGQYPARSNGCDDLLLDMADEPTTVAEAQRRHAFARGALARIRTRARAGELLAAWPARLAADGLRIGWWQEATEGFAAMHGPEVLAAAGISTAGAEPHAFMTWTHYLMAGGFGWTGLWPGLVHWPGRDAVAEATAILRAAAERRGVAAA